MLFLGVTFSYFSVLAQGNVGNYVFTDVNRNGIQDDGAENGINGVMIELWSVGLDGLIGTDDVIKGTILSDDDGLGNPGYFSFTGVGAGVYYLKFPLKSDTKHFLTKPNQTVDTDDSDADILTGTTPIFTVTNVDILDIDAGYSLMSPFCPSVCQAQFIDVHKAETGYKPGTQTNFSLSVPKFDPSLGTLIRTDVETRISIRHNYRIENYDLDSVRVINYMSVDSAWVNGLGIHPPKVGSQVDLLNNYVLQPYDGIDFVGPDYVEGDTAYTLLMDDTTTIDDVDLLAFTGPGNLPYVFNTRSSALFSGANNAFINLGRRVRFEVYIRYVYCKPICGSIGDYVWNDTNKDGVQDPTEVGLAGITVTLYDPSGRPVGVTTTDALGNYIFNNVPPGDYSVGFSLPTDYQFSPTAGTLDPTLDSDANPFSGLTTTFTLDTLQNITDIDAGMYYQSTATASLGNYIWFDANGNGQQTLGELGFANVTVSLYNALNNRLLATTLSNADGEYYFRNLAPGQYYVRVTPPLGYTFTSLNAGASNVDSDIDPVTGQTTTITLVNGQNDFDWDAGLVLVPSTNASVGDFVWNDINKDGIQDANEPGLAGIKVDLYDFTSNTLLASTETDIFGHYLFDNVKVDFGGGTLRTDYYMLFTLPPSYSVSPQTAGTDNTIDSDILPSGRTNVFILNAGDKKTDIDAGLFNPTVTATAMLGNYVWLDADKDGLQALSEVGVSGVTVILLNGVGTEIARTTTDRNGKYLFRQLNAGTYQLKFTDIPANTQFTLANQGGNPALDSDANPSTALSDLVTLIAGQADTTIDAGLIRALNDAGNASIGDFVWDDVDQDGQQGATEPGIANVQVIIRNEAGTFSDTTFTDGSGHYIFNGLSPDNYILTFSNLPVGYVFTAANLGTEPDKDSDVNPLGETNPITLTQGQSILTVDAGLIKNDPLLASVGDFVWNDLNQDGVQDGGESGVSGITVTLYTDANEIVAAAQTNESGFYLFRNLNPGDYKIVFSGLPLGFEFSPANALAATPTTDSDASTDPALLGTTRTFTLSAGDNLLAIDAGIFNTKAEIGNFVWSDVNENGVQDGTERGIAGITVSLKDDVGNVLATTVTDARGFYYFRTIDPGNYQLSFSDLPTGAIFTTPDASANTLDATDSDVNPANATIPTFTVAAGDRNYTFDAGIVPPKPASVKGIVWYDLNLDGLRDATEKPVSGVTVTLVDAGNNPIATTVTGADGVYYFPNVPAGTYTVIFTTFPSGAVLTTPNANGNANDDIDSDITALTPPNSFPITATGGSITVNSGDNVKGPDGGIIPSAGLKGRAWTDNNQNGIREAGDLGIPGVGVTLLDETLTPIRRTVTGEGGLYEFLNLIPGRQYYVQFDSIPSRLWTKSLVGDPSTDSDVNKSGTPNAGRTGILAALLPNELRPFIDAGYLTSGTAFPIELLTFTGYLKNQDATLKWKSVQEMNSSKYVLQRSIDGFKTNSGQDIAEIDAAGNSFKTLDYSYIDKDVRGLNVNKVWYRLKMLDIDGSFTISKEVVEIALNEEVGAIFMEVYPNPADAELFINYQLFDVSYGDIQIFNAMGQVMYQKTVKADTDMQNTAIDISEWASGTYLLQISTENSHIIQRIIVE